MADESVPRGLTAAAARDWVELGRPAAGEGTFDAGAVAHLPEPVRRWLVHAVAEGTPLARSVGLRMTGEIRLGRWAAFTAAQRTAVDGGFVWAATARPFGLPVVGFDRYTHGTGEMRWRLLGRVPVMSADGEDVTRSAAGRHAAELLLDLPTAALAPEVSWSPLDSDRAVATVRVGEGSWDVTLTIGPMAPSASCRCGGGVGSARARSASRSSGRRRTARSPPAGSPFLGG